MRARISVFLFLVACGATEMSGGGDDTTDPPGLFDACGGKIISSSGAVNADEYRAQAATWDRATIDCRLGPGFAHYHPGEADAARPMAEDVPLIQRGGGYLCPQFTSSTPGPAGYGSTSGQVAYAPDDASDPGLDRLQTVGWEGSGKCFQPLQGGWLGGPHPDPAITQWGSAVAGAVPIAKARTEYHETGDGIVIFSNGVIGTTGTQTSGSSKPTLQLPPERVPVAVAVTNFNELALVVVWNTERLTSELAVIALRAPHPGAFSIDLFAAPNEGGFTAMQLLGYIDLPLVAPTAIAAAGNNMGHNGPWVQSGTYAYKGIGSIFDDLSYAHMRAHEARWVWTTEPMEGQALFGTGGGAIIASPWENKVVVDLAPVFQFVRKVYVDPIATGTDEALYTMATAQGAWPFDFATNPEMKPTVVTTLDVEAPRVVRYGITTRAFAKGFTTKFLAWVGSLDGTVTAFDVSALAGRPELTTAPIVAVGSVQADPNPTSMHLTNSNDALFVSSRGNRSVQWIETGEASIDVVETFRDARLDDLVATDNNQRMGVITVGDFASGTVHNFERKAESCGESKPRACTYLHDGQLPFPGAVYWVDSANVN